MWRFRLIKLAEDRFQFVSTVMNFRIFIKAGDLLTSLEPSTLYHGVSCSDYYFLMFLTFLSYVKLNKVWGGFAGPAFLIIPILSPCLAHRRMLHFTVLPEPLCDMKNPVFWHMTPCSLMKTNRSFGRTCHLLLEGWRVSQARNQPVARSYKASYPQRIELFITTAIKTSNLTFYVL
jgi:hypothetical protein